LVETLGEEAFERNARYEEMRDIDAPACFQWLFGVFLDIYYCSKDGISYPDIRAYEEVYDVKFTLYEAGLIRRMSGWAVDETNKAWKERIKSDG
jgi:hypothetical protein